MGGCSILGCNQRSERRTDGLSFHAYPSDPELQKKWINAVGRQNWLPAKHAKVCSRHFDDDCFTNYDKCRHLKPFAIPTNYVNNNMNNQKEFDAEQSRSSQAINVMRQSSNHEIIPPPSKKQNILIVMPISQGTKKNIISTHTISQDVKSIKQIIPKPINTSGLVKKIATKTTGTPYQEILKKLERQKQISAERLKKLRAVRASHKRMMKKVAKLENLLLDLKRKIYFESKKEEFLKNIETDNEEFLESF